jgi:hypothetical protein
MEYLRAMENPNEESESKLPDTSFDPMQAYASAQFLIWSELGLTRRKLQGVLIKLLLFVAFLVLAGISTLFVVVALCSEQDSFKQEVFIKLSSGVAIFTLLPLMVQLASKSKWLVRLALVLLSVALGIVAYRSVDVVQSLLIEASVGLLLLAFLEFSIQRWIEALKQSWIENKEDMIAYLEKIDEAEDDLSP